MSALSLPFADYQLDDRYEARQGRVFMTGTQRWCGSCWIRRGGTGGGADNSRVRIRLSRFASWRSRSRVMAGEIPAEAGGITFLPAINEDLAATAVLGSQQVEGHPNREVPGVFGLWYGKGPGVDRAGDAHKHGNAYGSSPHGGFLVVAGDDHGCVSSSMPHQSDVAFMAWFMPC